MIEEGALDVRAVIARLELSADDLGLSRSEVAGILLRDPGSWPMSPAEQWDPMERWQEARLRDLDEVCRRLDRRFGVEAVYWLRSENDAVGTTPLAFLVSHADALKALRDVLRIEQAAGG